jgi:hypothetical protein
MLLPCIGYTETRQLTSTRQRVRLSSVSSCTHFFSASTILQHYTLHDVAVILVTSDHIENCRSAQTFRETQIKEEHNHLAQNASIARGANLNEVGVK